MIYSVEGLRREYQKGNRYRFLFFWGHTPPADGSINQSCLSQWWLQDFDVEGITYSCAEQYMMAEKARLFHDHGAAERIMAAGSPKDMKAYGRRVKNFDEDVWETRRTQIIRTANRAKFSQNPALLAYLLKTKGLILVEASPRDRVWGIGMSQRRPDVEDPTQWRGENLLGFALTEVRDELLKGL